MTIRTRLSLWYGLAMVAIIVTAGTLVWIQVGRDLRSSLDEALEVHALDVRSEVEADKGAAIDVRDPDLPGIFTVVFDPSGRVLRETRNAPHVGAVPPLGPSEVRVGAASYALSGAATSDGRRVVTGRTLADVDRARASLTAGLLGVGVIAALLALVGGWWLAGRALAPVGQLASTLEAIDVDDLGRRLPKPARLDELGRLVRTLNGMLSRIDDGMKRQQAFVAAASHDLRTPIAALRTELELALRGPRSMRALRVAIEAAHGDAVRLGQLANEVLELAAAEPGGRPLTREPLVVREVIESCARDFQPLAADRAIDLHVDASADIVSLDRLRIEQAVRNLLSNALRFAPTGSIAQLSASVTGPKRAGRGQRRTALEVVVTDQGPGVAAGIRALLFLPFVKSGDKRAGTGLGLATAAAAVRAHGGEIGYRDAPGGGAEFWFRVPA